MSSLRDEFYWMGQINKATIVINSKQKLLPKNIALEAARATKEVLEDGAKDPTKRVKTYITFEPLLIAKSGPEITLMHAGRSSQDIFATYRAAIMRDNVLEVASSLSEVMQTMTSIAEANRDTVLPNYTNGVAAQPNSYAHYLLGLLAGFERDFSRLKEFFKRLDRCAMGSTVLNGTCWPLDRQAMSDKLGFQAIAYNAFDATQVGQSDLPIEFAGITISLAIHITSFLEDLMVQYAQPRPWILLQEGGDNTYVSSAMPQKRNPGLVNNCRIEASTAIGEAQTIFFRAHNLQTGMVDPKRQELNNLVAKRINSALLMFDRVLKALKINKDRALEELNNDWTASQEVADKLMKDFNLPFRIGHHVASQMVGYARANNILPIDFPYSKVKEIYKEVIEKEYPEVSPELPMSEQEFRDSLNPIAIVKNRKTLGGPQPVELDKMLTKISQDNAANASWIKERKEYIEKSLNNLDNEFNQIGE